MKAIGIGFTLSVIASLMVIVVLLEYGILPFILSSIAIVVMVFAIAFYKVGLAEFQDAADEQKLETIIGIHRLVVTWQGGEPEHLQRFIEALRRQANDYEHLMSLERQKVARAQQTPYPPFISKN